jgi:hypothetical protein
MNIDTITVLVYFIDKMQLQYFTVITLELSGNTGVWVGAIFVTQYRYSYPIKIL